jgi:type I restriction enzyme S subunit
VGDILDIIGGGTPSTKVPEYWKGNIPWITSADIHGIKDIRPRKQISKKGVENPATNIVPKNSIIVVTRVGVGLGKVALTNFLCPYKRADRVFSFTYSVFVLLFLAK